MAAPAKRALFNRPKWAAITPKVAASSEPQQANRQQDDDFFSRSNETIAAIAAEEEERQRRKQARRIAEGVGASAGDSKEPGSKRQRVSTESHIEISSDDGSDDSDASDGLEQGGGAAFSFRKDQDPEKRELPSRLDKGKAVIREDISRPVLDAFDSRPSTPASPSRLPADVPQIPSDAQCADIRARQPMLAKCDNAKIRQLALLRWEREHERRTASPVARSPSHQLKSTPKRKPSLQSQKFHSPKKPSPVSSGKDKASAIELDDDSDDHQAPPDTPTRPAQPSRQAPTPASAPMIEIADESDQEFAEIERRAREKARRQRLLEEPVLQASAVVQPGANGTQAVPQGAGTGAVADPQMQLLVTSDLQNTRPLIISRKISQRFKEVREYWCHTNQLLPEIKSKVVLTWNKRRLYDSQSCKSLGFTTDKDGNLIYTSHNDDDFPPDYENKIHLIAVVEGLEPKPSAANTEAIESALHGSGLEAGADPSAEGQEETEEIRIIVRAKGYSDCKLIVKPTTLIQRIIGAFKKNGQVPESKRVALMFDGELLQPNATVGQTDIEDLEHIDAYVR